MDWLTQEGLTQGGLSRGVASNAPWPGEGAAPVMEVGKGTTKTTRYEERLACLARTIEAEIIPRLMLTHRALPRDAHGSTAATRAEGMLEVTQFTALILQREVHDAAAYIAHLRQARALSLETLYLELLAPTARRLGEMWEADLCDFTEVTVGLWRLQRVLLTLSEAFRGEGVPRAQTRRALLVPATGEQHTLGLFMVAEFLRRAGWEVWGDPPGSRAALIDIVGSERFDLAGVSVGTETRLDRVADTIRDMRRASRNRSIGVLVGGPAILSRPEAVSRLGADAMAIDARDAVLVAERLLSLQERR